MFSHHITPRSAYCHGFLTCAGVHFNSLRGQRRTRASKAFMVLKPWMTWSGPFAVTQSASSCEVKSRNAMVLCSELSSCGASFGITLEGTERSSHGPCLLFLVTAIGARKHWPSCVEPFSRKAARKTRQAARALVSASVAETIYTFFLNYEQYIILLTICFFAGMAWRHHRLISRCAATIRMREQRQSG